MKWHKVEDYPVGSDEYVLVSRMIGNKRESTWCYVVRMDEFGNWDDGLGETHEVQATDRWRHIELPED